MKFFPYAAATMLASWVIFPACQPSPSPVPSEDDTQEDQEGIFCGGIAGITCPEGYTCVDNPFDTCNPKTGGADCCGTCMGPAHGQCGTNGRLIVSADPDMCSRMKYYCPPGLVPFSSEECGCGCETPAPGEACGKNWCEPAQFCCNRSCGMCAPKGGACIQIACE